MKLLYCIFSFTLLTIINNSILAQSQNAWPILSSIQVEKKFDPDMGIETYTPNYGPIVSALEGKEVTLKGYVIPVNGKKEQSHFMFSSLPYSMCFFCGNAGPESAMEVYMKENQSVAYSDKAIKIKGILRLTRGNSQGLIYSLDQAEIID
ncbi:MAG: DUF3299 domain-containing protein [Bacteroidota bacterium]